MLRVLVEPSQAGTLTTVVLVPLKPGVMIWVFNEHEHVFMT